MNKTMWVAVSAMLALLAGGCEPRTNDVPSQPTAIVENGTTAEKSEASEVTGQAVSPEEGAAAETADYSGEGETASAEPDEATPQAEIQPPVDVDKTTTSTPVGTTAEGKIASSPQLVIYEASFGRVTFNHQLHGLSFDCTSCHAADPPGKIVLDKNSAHNLCKGCHQQMAAGPTQCSGCHKKN